MRTQRSSLSTADKTACSSRRSTGQQTCGPNGRPRPDVCALAASYAFGLAKNHPFLDGNERIAAVVCETFLNLHGVSLEASDNEWYDAVLALAAGETDEAAVAGWLRAHAAE